MHRKRHFNRKVEINQQFKPLKAEIRALSAGILESLSFPRP
jgi:hypothetical protein